jgi:hypothetical protein
VVYVIFNKKFTSYLLLLIIIITAITATVVTKGYSGFCTSVNVSCSLRCALRGLNAHELNEYLLFVNVHLMSP